MVMIGFGSGGSEPDSGWPSTAGFIPALLALICEVLFPDWCEIHDKDGKD